MSLRLVRGVLLWRKAQNWILLWQLSDCCLGRCVDGCAVRGRRVVKRNVGLKRGRRCDGIGCSHTLLGFTLNCCISVWDSDSSLRGNLRGSQKKPNLGRSPTGRFSTSDFNSHVPCGTPAILCRGLEMTLSEWHGQSMSGSRHGHGMLCVTQTRPYYISQIGKAQSEPLETQHGWGSAWAWYVMCKLALECAVNEVGE
jgi:hypothetical protein